MARRLLATCLAGILLAQFVACLRMPPGYLKKSEPDHVDSSIFSRVRQPPGYLDRNESTHSPTSGRARQPPGNLDRDESTHTPMSRRARQPPGYLEEHEPEDVDSSIFSRVRQPPGYLDRNESTHSPIFGRARQPPGYLERNDTTHSRVSRRARQPPEMESIHPLNTRSPKPLPGYSTEIESPVDSPTSKRAPGRADAAAAHSTQVLEDAFSALAVLQNSYFDAVNGTWPSSIDWTGAVVETIVSGMLTTLTRSLVLKDLGGDAQWKQKENLISSVYAQVVHSFFGQNAPAIKDEAYDDILWVVLGWLEATKFVQLHAELHYPGTERDCEHVPPALGPAIQTSSWHGYDWLCTFADRARAFWDLATEGWDRKLCHGGMTWNPKLTPYKNAITNELWIASSVAMYQHFPNDTFRRSWVADRGFPTEGPAYLAAAVEGYRWLRGVNMTNQQGLYVDGFHVDASKPGNVECDQRDETVYTYNQGVVLTGLQGLWSVTGSASYLEDGHRLVRSVVAATGWDLDANEPADKPSRGLSPWRGLGRGGILEERCDASGTCSQDGQTFKGIFFHHFTAFCAPVEVAGVGPGMVVNARDHRRDVEAVHDEECRKYLGWVKHNADAALETRDGAGRFGMWWGAGPSAAVTESDDGIDHGAPNTTDYRNKGTPQDKTWGTVKWVPGSRSATPPCRDLVPRPNGDIRKPTGGTEMKREAPSNEATGRADDPNNRGRGRTVETQAGGIALLRAYWELSQPR